MNYINLLIRKDNIEKQISDLKIIKEWVQLSIEEKEIKLKMIKNRKKQLKGVYILDTF